jgi:hypothetical protein
MVKSIPVDNVSDPVPANLLKKLFTFLFTQPLAQTDYYKKSSGQICLLHCNKKLSDHKSAHIRTYQLL